MSGLQLESLTIKNYRALEDVSIENLARINLITGHNNVGKTSLLEAVRLWSAQENFSPLLHIIDARDEALMLQGQQPHKKNEEGGVLGSVCGSLYLFSGYPSIDDTPKPIELIEDKYTLCISIIEKDIETSDSLFSSEKVLDLAIDDSSKNSFGLFNYFTIPGRRGVMTSGKTQSGAFYPCVFLSAAKSSIDAYPASSSWDKIVLTPKEDHVIKGLQLIDPRISRVNFVEGDFGSRIPVVLLAGQNAPIPLGGLGDGVSRLFEIMLALVNSEDGLLLIDEFESGLHYSIQEKAWEVILKLAKELNIQIFATTHSSDCVDAFQRVSEESKNENEMQLIRLLRDKEDIIYSETLFGSKLATRLELGREVR